MPIEYPPTNTQGLPGDSAYEIAVANGFVGTEEQWIASLGGQESAIAYEAIDLGAVTYLENGEIRIASKSNPGIVGRALLFTRSQALQGEPIQFIREGPISDASWDWDLTKPIWLAVDGGLTQAPPSTGLYWIVARPESPTTAYFRPENPILFGE